MGSIQFFISSFVLSVAFFCVTSFSMFANAAAVTAPESDSKGPFTTATSEYHFPAAIDADVLAGQSTEVWGRVFWPSPLINHAAPSKKRPLLVFLHGNHGTCGIGKSPRNDSSCEYTNEGTCPVGYSVTPNHEGYNYVAETLASWGYIVVSINANRGITCGGGQSDDWGLVLARGRLVLKHLQLWNEWTTNGGAPTTLGAADLFKDAVDMTNVGLMGHSRGGEGVRAALNMYRDPKSPWVAKIPGLDIRAIYEIGAVDGQSNRVLDAPSVAWNQTLPLCDGDVSDLQGRMPFERMLARYSAKNEIETRPSPKSLTMMWGANHNYFNTEWQTSDSYGCSGAPTHKAIFDETKAESLEQQSLARQSMTAFFRAHVGADKSVALAQNFDPAYDFPVAFSKVGLVDRDFITGYEFAKTFRVDDFTAATGLNPSGAKNLISIVQVDHKINAEPPVANISWLAPGEDQFYQTNFKEFGQSADISTFDFLDLRVGHVMTDPVKEVAMAPNFSVQLVASDDSLSAQVAIANYAIVHGPPNDNAELTQTARLPLGSFGKFDLTKIRGVRFVFNKTEKSKVRLAHVRFGVTAEKMTPFATSKTFAEQLAMNEALQTLAGTPPVVAMDAAPAQTTPADMILPEDTKTSPYSLAAPLRGANSAQRRASWMKPRKISQSRELHGLSAFELVVASDEEFPIQDSLPVLNIENHLFPIARFPSNGKTRSMIFTISKESYALLPPTGRAQLQYGLKHPTRVWTLPDFSKADNKRDLNE